MDLSNTLQKTDRIIAILKSFPRSKKIAKCNETFTTKSNVNDAEERALENCYTFLNKIEEEIEEQLSQYDDEYFAAVRNRESFIHNKIAEKITSEENQIEKLALIKEIEFYEKQNVTKINKIYFNAEETKDLINKIHEEDLPDSTNVQLQGILRKNVVLNYENVSEKEIRAVEKIKMLFN